MNKAHMLERQASILVFLGGCQMGFLSGDITKLLGIILLILTLIIIFLS